MSAHRTLSVEIFLRKKGTPPVSRRGPFSQPNYSVISMQHALCGQHAPPPQQLSLLEPTGVAAVRPTSAARMSKYFITPPVELRCISAANIAPSHCGGESAARRRTGRSISPIEAVAIARENCVSVELRNAVLIRNTAHQHERRTRCRAAVRRLRILILMTTATAVALRHLGTSFNFRTAGLVR